MKPEGLEIMAAPPLAVFEGWAARFIRHSPVFSCILHFRGAQPTAPVLRRRIFALHPRRVGQPLCDSKHRHKMNVRIVGKKTEQYLPRRNRKCHRPQVNKFRIGLALLQC